jgi:hypothetical protein
LVDKEEMKHRVDLGPKSPDLIIPKNSCQAIFTGSIELRYLHGTQPYGHPQYSGSRQDAIRKKIENDPTSVDRYPIIATAIIHAGLVRIAVNEGHKRARAARAAGLSQHPVVVYSQEYVAKANNLPVDEVIAIYMGLIKYCEISFRCSMENKKQQPWHVPIPPHVWLEMITSQP